MSAEPKWCFLNYPKGGTNIFQLRTTNWFRGYVSSNQIHPLFGTFAPKLGQKGPKMGLKCLWLVWFGLIWLGCDPGSWQYPNFFSICPKLQIWKSDFREFGRNFKTHYKRQLELIFSDQTSLDHNLAIPNHTIPNQDILSPFLAFLAYFLGKSTKK